MKIFSRSSAKHLCALVLMVCMLLIIGMSVASADEYLVDKEGYLAPGQRISGSFTLPNLFSNYFGVIVGAGNVDGTTDGYLDFVFVAERHDIPCNGTANLIYEGTWPYGTHEYILTNKTNKTVAYTLAIIKK